MPPIVPQVDPMNASKPQPAPHDRTATRRGKSHEAFARARRLIPGGVNSPARAFGGVGGEPIFFASAEGQHLTDIDGNTYLDYIGSWGPMILGHRHPRVVAAIERALSTGTSYGAPTEAESHLADLIIAAVPSIEKVRMVSSGTEAAMSAVRLARGFTGRDVIVKSQALVQTFNSCRPARRRPPSVCLTHRVSQPAPRKTPSSSNTTSRSNSRISSGSAATRLLRC